MKNKLPLFSRITLIAFAITTCLPGNTYANEGQPQPVEEEQQDQHSRPVEKKVSEVPHLPTQMLPELGKPSVFQKIKAFVEDEEKVKEETKDGEEKPVQYIGPAITPEDVDSNTSDIVRLPDRDGDGGKKGDGKPRLPLIDIYLDELTKTPSDENQKEDSTNGENTSTSDKNDEIPIGRIDPHPITYTPPTVIEEDPSDNPIFISPGHPADETPETAGETKPAQRGPNAPAVIEDKKEETDNSSDTPNNHLKPTVDNRDDLQNWIDRLKPYLGKIDANNIVAVKPVAMTGNSVLLDVTVAEGSNTYHVRISIPAPLGRNRNSDEIPNREAPPVNPKVYELPVVVDDVTETLVDIPKQVKGTLTDLQNLKELVDVLTEKKQQTVDQVREHLEEVKTGLEHSHRDHPELVKTVTEIQADMISKLGELKEEAKTAKKTRDQEITSIKKEVKNIVEVARKEQNPAKKQEYNEELKQLREHITTLREDTRAARDEWKQKFNALRIEYQEMIHKLPEQLKDWNWPMLPETPALPEL